MAPRTMTFDVPFGVPPTHKYQETWSHEDDLFCPSCGKQEVWSEDGAGDYYEGVSYICVACSTCFTLPTLYSIDATADHASDVERVRRLKGGEPRDLSSVPSGY